MNGIYIVRDCWLTVYAKLVSVGFLFIQSALLWDNGTCRVLAKCKVVTAYGKYMIMG